MLKTETDIDTPWSRSRSRTPAGGGRGGSNSAGPLRSRDPVAGRGLCAPEAGTGTNGRYRAAHESRRTPGAPSHLALNG
ncbi:hypothetical protein Q5P01_019242 [Channa striata]|uniref:Uncharacterized protein n=1 Tax=Channa striata TaxID=64152 RepID=A0AA88SBE3_CHASR|nr:hypothetical protein Q5P01_019242 [Channa striata]